MTPSLLTPPLLWSGYKSPFTLHPLPASQGSTTRASNEGYPKVPEDFTIMEKAPSKDFSWLKAPASAFTFKTLC